LGAHRAGSSTIQGILVRHRERLLAAGVTAWTRKDLVASPTRRQLLALPRAAARGLVAAWPISRAPTDSVVVSEENLLGKMPGHRGAGFYREHVRAIRGLGALGRVFDLGLRFVVRRQDRFLVSVWSFRVSRGSTEDLPSFVARLGGTLHWLPIALALARTSADVRIALFEDLFASKSESDIGRFLGVPTGRAWRRPLRRGNVGLRGVAVHAMRHLNRLANLDAAERKVVRVALARLHDAVPPADLAEALRRPASLVAQAFALAAREPPADLSASERRAFLAPYAEENRTLLAMKEVSGDRASWAG
jgi:hypothetical protein